MKHLKMFGLVVMAVPLIAVFSGVGAAQATVLCETTTTPCGSGTLVEASLKSGTTAFLESTGGLIEATCTRSTIKGVAESTTESVDSEVAAANVTWSECTNTIQTIAGGTLELHRIAGTDNGTVTAKGFEVTAVLVGISCTYGAGEGLDLGVLKAGEDPVVAINVIVKKTKGSFACPSDLRWNAEYTVTSPRPLYVESSEGVTVLCETTTTPCGAEPEPFGSPFPAGTEIDGSLESESKMIFKVTEGQAWNVCIGSTLKAKTTNEGGSSETVGAEVTKGNLVWGECGGTFETLAVGPIEIHHIAGTDNGTVTIKNLEMTWSYPEAGDCTYGSGEWVHFGTLTGGEHPVLDVKVVISKKGEKNSIICISSLVLEASFAVTGSQELYVEPS